MRLQRYERNSMRQVSFYTKEMSPEEQEEYALEKLNNGSYKNCIIDEVYVNGRLIFRNVEIS